QLRDRGYDAVKIKIGGAPLEQDLRRIEAALRLLRGGSHLAVDAMNSYWPDAAVETARPLPPPHLQLFQDIFGPLDLSTATAPPPVAAGEALFSLAEAKLLARHGGLRADRDVLVFDPVHCYGLPGYLEIVDHLVAAGWLRERFWPHGGHLFALHVVAALG